VPVRSLGERWVVFAHAHLAQARGDPVVALRLFDRVTAPSVDDGAHAPRPPLTPRPALGRATALAALGQYAEAEALLLSVREVVQRQGTRPMIWRTQMALGHLYEATGRTEDAQHAYLAARQMVETLAASLPGAARRLAATDAGDAPAQLPPLTAGPTAARPAA
jgi:hypothetical protein